MNAVSPSPTSVHNPIASALLNDLLRAVSIHGVTADFASECLEAMDTGLVVAELDALLADPQALCALGERAYRHANGFYKLPLHTTPYGLRVRLHYWPTAQTAEENIHNHRWRMASRVLVGNLESDQWRIDERGESYPLYEYRKDAPGSLHAQETPLGEARIRRAIDLVHREGTAYAMDAKTLHRIHKVDDRPTVTLMVQSAPVRDTNWMFAGNGIPDIEVTPLGTERTRALLVEIRALIAEVQ